MGRRYRFFLFSYAAGGHGTCQGPGGGAGRGRCAPWMARNEARMDAAFAVPRPAPLPGPKHVACCKPPAAGGSHPFDQPTRQRKSGGGLRSAAECCIIPLLVRGGAVWQLVGLITRRSQVQILPPLPTRHQTRAIPETGSLFSFQGPQRRAQLAPTRCKVYHQRAGGISDGWLCMERDHPATGFDQKLGFAGDRVSAPCGRNPMTGFHRTKGPVGPFAFPERARRGPDLFHIQQQGRL